MTPPSSPAPRAPSRELDAELELPPLGRWMTWRERWQWTVANWRLGRHSNIPPCCCAFFALRDLMAKNDWYGPYSMWPRHADAQYVPCPVCWALLHAGLRRANTLHVCDWSETCERYDLRPLALRLQANALERAA